MLGYRWKLWDHFMHFLRVRHCCVSFYTLIIIRSLHHTHGTQHAHVLYKKPPHIHTHILSLLALMSFQRNLKHEFWCTVWRVKKRLTTYSREGAERMHMCVRICVYSRLLYGCKPTFYLSLRDERLLIIVWSVSVSTSEMWLSNLIKNDSKKRMRNNLQDLEQKPFVLR